VSSTSRTLQGSGQRRTLATDATDTTHASSEPTRITLDAWIQVIADGLGQLTEAYDGSERWRDVLREHQARMLDQACDIAAWAGALYEGAAAIGKLLRGDYDPPDVPPSAADVPEASEA